MRTLSIVIPVYNEEKYICAVIDKVANAKSPGYRKEIIIVDDGSHDLTAQKIKQHISHPEQSGAKPRDPSISVGMTNGNKVIFIEKKYNEGKGAALKEGFRAATGDVMMVQDADEEYSTKDYPALLKPFTDDNADVVYGSRNKKRENFHNRYSYFTFFVGGLALTWFVNFLYQLRLTDQPTGYKLFSSKLKRMLLLPDENRFSYEVAVTAILAKMNIKFIEVPIHYKPRTLKEGKKINALDFVKSVAVGLKYLNGNKRV